MPLVFCFIDLEDDSGVITLEDDTSDILLEDFSCPQPPPPPPPGPPVQGTTQFIIPAYPYQQYEDDPNIDAFFAAYNIIAQSYLNWANKVQLGDYTGPFIVGPLLDWIAEGLYGIRRPALPYGVVQSIGPLNTWAPNTIALNTGITNGATSVFVTTDDVFKRIITWHFFKGDGQQFSIEWLKRRVMRFLIGVNGVSPNIDETYQISVTFGVDAQVTITITLIPTGLIALNITQIFQAAVASASVALPFQFVFNVVIVNDLGPTGLTDVAGVLHVTDITGWPTSSSGLLAGAVWANGGTGGIVTIVPGVTPNPFAAPVFFGLVTAMQLQTLGGGDLPLVDPHVVGQIWNSSNVAMVSAG